MATQTLPHAQTTAKLSLVDQVTTLGDQVDGLEQTVRRVRSVLDAISAGSLLSFVAQGHEVEHNAATHLLDMLRDEIARYDKAEELEVSARLYALSYEVGEQ